MKDFQSRNMKLKWRTALLVVGLFSVLFAGCGGSNGPFQYVPVSGKVTYEDGTAIPVSGMKIYFHSLEPPKGDMRVRPGIGSVGSDGTFKDVTSYKYGDGLVLGKYKVSLVSEEDGKLTRKIPADYAKPEKTPLQVDITQSGQVLEIKIPKPKG
jgi:hypothetical protein